MVDLMRCPFCGEAARRSLVQPKNGPNNWAIGCSKCIMQTEWVATEAEAIAAWNRRPEPATPAGDDALVDSERAYANALASTTGDTPADFVFRDAAAAIHNALDLRDAAYAKGRAEERADVVAWLRNGAQWDDPVPTPENVENLSNADAIERGQHERPKR